MTNNIFKSAFAATAVGVLALATSAVNAQSITGTASAGVGYAAPASISCPLGLAKGLYRGSRGAAVQALQQMLASLGYFNTTATGYFGPVTYGAVVSYQRAEGLPTTGYFGPLTLAAITKHCSGTNPGPSASANLSATPTSGSAPLSVSFSGTGLKGGTQYIIEYGDGQTSGPQTAVDVCMHLSDGSGGCPRIGASHTYTQTGTYTATLEPYMACMWSNPRCMIAVMPLAKATVTVGGSVSTNAPTIYSITPVSGPVGTKVTIDGFGFSSDNTINFGSGVIQHIPIASSIAIACTTDPSCHGGIHQTLVFTVPSSVAPYCAPGMMCAMYMQQITPGSYQVSVRGQDGSTSSNSVTFTVTSGSGGSTPLSISGLDAPSTLPIGTPGTWTVRLSSSSVNQNLHYSVVWGDEAAAGTSAIMAPQPTTVQTSATFTHAYSRSGTYTPTFTVTDDSGRSVSTSATVTVTPIY